MGREKWAWKMAGTKAAVENEEARSTEIIFSTRIVWPGQTDFGPGRMAAGSLFKTGHCPHWTLMILLG